MIDILISYLYIETQLRRVTLYLAIMKYFGRQIRYRATVVTVLGTDFGIGSAYRGAS